MASFLRPVFPLCRSLTAGIHPRAALNIARNRIPLSRMQHQPFSSFSRKIIDAISRVKELSYQDSPLGKATKLVLETVTGMKQLNEQETAAAIIDHQKLLVAHASIWNHSQASAHYEMVYSMQLFSEPKDFSTRDYFLDLLQNKKPEELSMNQLGEIVDLYNFAIAQNTDPFASFALKEKLETYQSFLNRKTLNP